MIKIRYSSAALWRSLLTSPHVRLVYPLGLLIPLVVRAIPESLTSIPLGFDTAIYLASAKKLATSYAVMPFFARVLGVLYSMGVDLMVFMKVYPVVVFAATVFLIVFYADRQLGWDTRRLLVLIVAMSLSAAMLRMSWDLHRQSLATVLLLVYMCIDPWRGLTKRKIILSVFLIALIALTHELTLVVISAMNLYLAILALKDGRNKQAVTFFTLAFFPPIIYEVGIYTSYFKLASPAAVFENVLNKVGQEGFPSLVSYSLGLFVATFWYILPLVPLGFFYDKYLTPWFLAMALGYLSQFITPFWAVRLADRWMLYMALPLTLYAANALARFPHKSRSGVLMLAVALTLISINGVSMLGVIDPQPRLPSSMYIGFIPSTMVFSTAKPEHIDAIVRFSKIINAAKTGNACIVTHEPWFKYWAIYLTEAKVYPFSGRDPESAIANAEKSGCEDIYVIWFKGQVKKGDLIAESSQLVLHRISKT